MLYSVCQPSVKGSVTIRDRGQPRRWKLSLDKPNRRHYNRVDETESPHSSTG
jgi:hypothetical protein